MAIRSIPIPNSRLTEGDTHPFAILKVISLGEGEDWFVLQDPLGYKILMPQWYYRDYGFEPGQTISCRIDKINCNGRMFLEPRHPHYEEGQAYSFEVTGSGHRINILDQDEYYLQVSDVFGNHWEVLTTHAGQVDLPPPQIRCLVKRIKKGRLFLLMEGQEAAGGGLATGRSYRFSVIDERINPEDGHSYYILEDPTGGRHLLRKKYYVHYGLGKGQEVVCRVGRLGTEGLYALEPDHPCYRTGEVAAFDVARLEELVFSDGYRQPVLVLKDCFGEEVKVHLSQDDAVRMARKQSVRGLVKDIRKSRLELDVTTLT
jgi:hypothetical protein